MIQFNLVGRFELQVIEGPQIIGKSDYNNYLNIRQDRIELPGTILAKIIVEDRVLRDYVLNKNLDHIIRGIERETEYVCMALSKELMQNDDLQERIGVAITQWLAEQKNTLDYK